MRITVLFALAALCGCTSDADFAVKYAPDFRRDGRAVSVFGVYKDGRMSADAWADLAPRFALGGTCETAYSAEIVANDRALATAIDDQARSDGVTDPLLDLFADGAAGDAILLVTVAGQTPREIPTKKGAAPQSAPSPSPPPGRGGRHGPRGGDPSLHHGTSHDAFEVAASLFSTREHRTVAVVAMTYTGKSTDEALGLFAEKMRRELPAMRCAGWKRDVRVDPDRVRAVRPDE